MKITGLFLIALICGLFVLSFSCYPVYASADYVIAYNDWGGGGGIAYIADAFPSLPAGSNSAEGNTFNASETDGYLTVISVKMDKLGSPDCNISMGVGSWDEDNDELDVWMENSTTSYEATSLTGSMVIYNFTFSQTTHINDSMRFVFFLYAHDEVLLGGGNYVGVDVNNAGAYNFGVRVDHDDADWGEQVGSDLTFYIYGNAVSLGATEEEPAVSLWWMIGVSGLILMFGGVLIPSYQASRHGWLDEDTIKFYGYGFVCLLIGYGLVRVWLFGGFNG